MLDKHEVVGLFPSHVEAEAAVIDLQKAGFDLQKISIIGKDYQTTEHVRGFLTWKDTAKAGAGEAGYWGSFFGGLFGILTGVGLLFVPGVGPKEKALKYETEIKAGKFVVIASGTDAEIEQAQAILKNADHEVSEAVPV
jgi:hypothetical protein